MAVVLDPHFKKPGNKITGEAVAVIGTKYRMLVPAHAPFFTTSLVVKSGGKILTLGDDYVITHPYETGMLRTAYLIHGMIWIVNDKYKSNFTVDYHAVGCGEATQEQITAERELNKGKYPSACQWDTVIGDVYFPPVDIQFDWENWKGELELMQAIAGLGDSLGEVVSRLNPIARNSLDLEYRANSKVITSEQYAAYDNKGGFTYNTARHRYSLSYNATTFNDYSLSVKHRIPAILPDMTKLNPNEQIDWMLCYANGGASILRLQLKQRKISLVLTVAIGSGSTNYDYTLINGLTDDELKNDIDFSVTRQPGNGVYVIVVKTNKQTMDYTFNVDTPPDEFSAGYSKTDVAKWLKFKTNINLNWYAGENDYIQIRSLPGAPEPDVDNDVYQLIVKYHQLVEQLYRNAPAHEHVTRKDNPHNDTWGPIRALELNGIATDAALAYGKTKPQLTDYVNAKYPTQATLTAQKKLLRTSASKTADGTIGTLPGFTSFTTEVDPVSMSKYVNPYFSESYVRQGHTYHGALRYTGTKNGFSASFNAVPANLQDIDFIVTGRKTASGNEAVGTAGLRFYENPGSNSGKYVEIIGQIWGGTLTIELALHGYGNPVPSVRYISQAPNPAIPDGDFTLRFQLKRTGNVFDAVITVNGKTYSARINFDNMDAALEALENRHHFKSLINNVVDSVTISSQNKGNTVTIKKAPDVVDETRLGAQFVVDPKSIKFIGQGSTDVNVGNNPVTLQAGDNQLVLYPDDRGLLWRGKKLLDPTTVAPYLPGNTAGGTGLFYGASTATVELTGSGIKASPFVATFILPVADDVTTLACWQLTDEFGTAENLAATPALIEKLDAEFTGKLVAVKSYINDMQLTSSVTIDKITFGLGNVANTPDVDLPISTAQRAELDKYSPKVHQHPFTAFGTGNATTAKRGLIKFGLDVDDATLALDGSVVIAQTSQIEKMESVVGGVDSEARLDIIRFGKSGNDLIDVTVKDKILVTLPASTYFIGGETYAVPLMTINVSERFPKLNTEIYAGIFVDIVDNKAKYIIHDSYSQAETDTMTRVGLIGVNDISEVFVTELRNVTRLDDFRELKDHKADDNAHIHRSASRAVLGLANLTVGAPCWASGLQAVVRGEADWRYVVGGQYKALDGVKYDQLASKWIFDAKGASDNVHGFIHNMFPAFKNAGMRVSWETESNAKTGTVLETILGCWKNTDGEFMRLSLLITRGYRLTDSNGEYCYAGFGLNFGSGKSVVIGFTPTKRVTAAPWSSLQPEVSFTHNRSANNAITFNARLTLAGTAYTIVVYLSATDKYVSCTAAGGTTQKIPLADRLTGFNIEPIVNDPYTPIYYGLGGLYEDEVRADIRSAGDSATANKVYGTLLDYISNYSSLNRVRVMELAGVSSDPETLNALVATEFNNNLADYAALPIPPYLNKERVMSFIDTNNKVQAVIIRD
ncbi:hypothetical protein IG651_002746 [Salmonella enterica subsp. enterica serovar Enteritidis]|nr:hypothetical protein [Salmonella enterica subsp. enterica serovar Enteritidis]